MFLAILKNVFALKAIKIALSLLILLAVFILMVLYYNQNQLPEHSVSMALLDIGLVVTLGSLSFYLTSHKGFYAALLVSVVLSVSYVWVTLLLFGERHWVSMLFPLLAVILSLLTGSAIRYFLLQHSVSEIQSTFRTYKSDKLVARLEEEPEAAKIGGDNKEVTIIFTDIKGFTTFSENHTPREVVNRLNEYLGEMVQVIEEFDGYVDKFIGDGILAYWGAPLAQAEHEKQAIACILAMKKTMETLCAKWQTEGVEPFSIRAGVQSGEVVAGNIGLHGKKMEYTVIGDTVNQAARLESSAKYYGVDVLVGENTYQATRDFFQYRELDKVRMMGKQVPVKIYELSDPFLENTAKLNQQFAAALAVYRKYNWALAERLFADILLEFPHDKPSELYVDRCQYFGRNPVGSDWDGVFNRRGK